MMNIEMWELKIHVSLKNHCWLKAHVSATWTIFPGSQGASWLMLISDKHVVQFFHNAISFFKNRVINSNEQLKIAL